MIVATPCLLHAGDVTFDPNITKSQFREFSTVVSEGVYADPIEPARPTSLLGFNVGIAATAIKVDDKADFWVRSVSNDITTSGYLIVPRVVASKGFGFGTISASLAKVQSSDAKIIGAAVDIPIIKGTLATPSLTARGVYSQLQGVKELDLRNLGAEVSVAKGFGPVMPFLSAGMVRTQSKGRVERNGALLFKLDDEFDSQRITAGVRISLLVPKIVVQVTQGKSDRMYSAKISLGI